LAIALWHTTGNREEVIQYLEQAKVLITAYPGQFDFLNKDEEWNEIQEFILLTSKKQLQKKIKQ